MKLQSVTGVVTGLRRFKGDVDGQSHDFTKAFIETDLNEGDNSRGTCTQEFTLGKSDIYDRLLSVPLPFQAKFDVTVTTNGKRTMTSMKLVDVINQPKKAAA